MKLTHVRIKDFRSFFGVHDFDIANGVNYFVGPNNCGKSNLFRAIELALDPDAEYDAERDRPVRPASVGAPPTTRITLTFQLGKSSPERTLLDRARKYELGVRSTRGAATKGNIKTYARDGEVRLATSFVGGARQTTFQAKGFGAASLPIDDARRQRLEAQFRSAVRFGVVHSGMDLGMLLQSKFREVLELVIRDHLGDELARAEKERAEYVSALQSELLEPLRSRILERVQWMFPEITVAQLVPDVPALRETLSSVDIQLGDTAITQLADKGTGLRGAVLVSMLHYLAEQSRRSLVLAVEEPEAFLHPAAQEVIMGELQDLAVRNDVSLLVTTHSPYVISREPETLITELRKGCDGASCRAATARGDESRAELLGSLYREVGFARILERSLEIPAGTKAVLVTEGYTDGLFLRLVCEAAGRPDLLKGLHIIPAGRANKVVPQAILAEAATEHPVIALLDHDDNGRAAADKLKGFNWEPHKRLLSLSAWPDRCGKHDIEIEDLLPGGAVAKLVASLGEDVALDSKERCGNTWHLRLSEASKEAATKSLASHLANVEGSGLIWLAEEVWTRADRVAADRAKRLAATTSSGDST